MSIVVHPRNRLARVPINDGRNSQLLPAFQSVAKVGQDSYIEIDLRPSASTSAMSDGSDLLFDLEYNNGFNIKDIVLRIRTSAAGTVQTVPAPYWIKRIKVIANKGSGDTLQDIYPENIVFHYMTMNKDERNAFSKKGMIKFAEQNESYRLNEPINYTSGDVRDVLIPFPLSFWQMDAIQLQHMKEDIRIRIELNSDFAISGTASNITVTGVSLQIKQDELSDMENAQWVKDSQRQEHVYNYLDVIKVTDNTQTMTAGSENKYDLQSIVGKVAFLLVVHKGATSPIASDETLFDYYEIGDAGTFDLRSPNNESLLGKGNSLRADRVEYLWTQFMRDKPLSGMYMIPFCHDVHKALSGTVDNYFEFVGDKETLAVTYGAAGTAEVQTVTLNNAANDGGYYKIAVDGDMTNSIIYSTAVGTMKTNYEGLKPVSEKKYTSTFSGTAAATFTITYDANRDGRPSDEIGLPQVVCESINDGTVAEFAVSSLTTEGIKGWATSSARQVEIYAYYYKRLKVKQNGRLSCKTL